MNNTPKDTVDTTDAILKQRAHALGLWGLLANWPEIKDAPWLPQLLSYEETERARRSLERRQRSAHIGKFKHMVDFDWDWPRQIDREAVREPPLE